VYVLFDPNPAGNGLGPPGADKLIHLTLFALLAGTTRWRFGPARPLVVAVAAYAGLSELVQALWLVHRSGDVRDLVADLLGVALGWALAGRWTARRPRAEAGRVTRE